MTAATAPLPDFAAARRAMIDSQLRTSGINEPWVLERMLAVRREDFVPEHARVAAYVDRAIPLGEGRMLPAPLVQAQLLSEARPQMSDRALVIDSGSGYLSALLEGLAGSVVSALPEDAAKGAIKGEFTLVLVDGAVEHVPQALAKRLADNGRLVTGVIEDSVTRLAVGRKAGGALALLPLAEIGIPRLAAFDKPKVWSF